MALLLLCFLYSPDHNFPERDKYKQSDGNCQQDPEAHLRAHDYYREDCWNCKDCIPKKQELALLVFPMGEL
jgi:hypothetical protein